MKPADKKQDLVAYRVTKADAQRIKARKYRHESLSEAARQIARERANKIRRELAKQAAGVSNA